MLAEAYGCGGHQAPVTPSTHPRPGAGDRVSSVENSGSVSFGTPDRAAAQGGYSSGEGTPVGPPSRALQHSRDGAPAQPVGDSKAGGNAARLAQLAAQSMTPFLSRSPEHGRGNLVYNVVPKAPTQMVDCGCGPSREPSGDDVADTSTASKLSLASGLRLKLSDGVEVDSVNHEIGVGWEPHGSGSGSEDGEVLHAPSAPATTPEPLSARFLARVAMDEAEQPLEGADVDELAARSTGHSTLFLTPQDSAAGPPGTPVPSVPASRQELSGARSPAIASGAQPAGAARSEAPAPPRADVMHAAVPSPGVASASPVPHPNRSAAALPGADASARPPKNGVKLVGLSLDSARIMLPSVQCSTPPTPQLQSVAELAEPCQDAVPHGDGLEDGGSDAAAGAAHTKEDTSAEGRAPDNAFATPSVPAQGQTPSLQAAAATPYTNPVLPAAAPTPGSLLSALQQSDADDIFLPEGVELNDVLKIATLVGDAEQGVEMSPKRLETYRTLLSHNSSAARVLAALRSTAKEVVQQQL